MILFPPFISTEEGSARIIKLLIYKEFDSGLEKRFFPPKKDYAFIDYKSSISKNSTKPLSYKSIYTYRVIELPNCEEVKLLTLNIKI